MTHYIYKITNTINNKIYIGRHSTKNINDGYMGSGTHLKRALEKYGIQFFKKEILFECDSVEDLIELEKEIVDEEFVARFDTYNIALGGSGWEAVNATRANIYIGHAEQSKINLRKGHGAVRKKLLEDEEFRKDFCQKVSNGVKLYQSVFGNPFTGKSHTEETKKKISASSSKHQKGKGNSQYGTMWIYSNILKQSKKIMKNKKIPTGWKKGRKQKF